LARHAAEELRSGGFPSAAADLLAAGATSQAMAGNTGRAREMASLAAQASMDRTTSLDLTLGYAYAGDFRQADALLAHLFQQYPESTSLKQVYAPDVRALEAIQQHKADAAINALEGVRTYDFAIPLSLPYIRGLACLAAHQTQQAIAEFQKIVDHPGVQATSPVHSLAHLGLARSYAQAGNTEKALTAYQDFFALWKDADPDVPVLQQAKAEYAKLK
jgi:tetratricopeptide (TPR) repeat protein